MELPNRRKNRLENYDYNADGCYFITICTKDRKAILSKIVGAGVLDCPRIQLQYHDVIADRYIRQLNGFYNNISIPKYVIMPDHIHLIVTVNSWQRSYYDHIIRSQSDYNEIWEYIENNPKKWILTHKTQDA